MDTVKNIIVEGIDIVGKSTLIRGLQDQLGFTTVIHYEKPKALTFYGKTMALELYQRSSFRTMFKLLESGGGIICDRAHLGEAIYAPMYRGYSGDYVFDMERSYTKASDNTLLVLLTASDTSFLVDDGESHDFSKRNEEQELFIQAFERSNMKHKLLIDVSCSTGYRPKDEILMDVIQKVLMLD